MRFYKKKIYKLGSLLGVEGRDSVDLVFRVHCVLIRATDQVLLLRRLQKHGRRVEKMGSFILKDIFALVWGHLGVRLLDGLRMDVRRALGCVCACRLALSKLGAQLEQVARTVVINQILQHSTLASELFTLLK